MKLELRRFVSTKEETMGVLLIDDIPVCWTLEDQKQLKKVYGETRIAAGEYDIKLRTVGGHHDRYSKMFPRIHKGMLELQGVPNFQFILIHIGNFDTDTDGCILVGNHPSALGTRLSIKESKVCYEKIYKLIINEINQGKNVRIKIVDRD